MTSTREDGVWKIGVGYLSALGLIFAATIVRAVWLESWRWRVHLLMLGVTGLAWCIFIILNILSGASL
jgi:hypothetical protein